MIEQLSNAITFYAHFIASKVGSTGLTVTADVYRGSTSTPIVSGGSATELGGGIYKYTLASGSVSTEDEYIAIFKTASTAVDQQHIPSLWAVNKGGVEHLNRDISDVYDKVSGAVVTLQSPVAQNSNVEIVRGDSYDADDNRELTWTSTSWPSLTGATVNLTVRASDDSVVLSATCSTSGTQTVVCELSSTVTGATTVRTGRHKYDVQAKLATSTNVVTLVRGAFTILEDQTRS